jgi:hypothetical protein
VVQPIKAAMAIGLVRVVGAAPIARQPADRGDGAAAPIILVSMSGQIDTPSR